MRRGNIYYIFYISLYFNLSYVSSLDMRVKTWDSATRPV